MEGLIAHLGLGANHPQRKATVARVQRQLSGAGDLSGNRPAFQCKLGAGDRDWTKKLQLPQVAVNGSARTDALHDLLAKIAAFVKTQRPHLRGLLRQVALGNVDAVGGNPFSNAKCLEVAAPTGTVSLTKAFHSKGSRVAFTHNS